ncbi:MAG: SDR family NAD(P)-dependent oxidoreductase, partial [Cyanobacteriota bacterium]|nr:SDR family NAD(P)-dependent oxidoreductase [Cyanobacteriota bacterium]
MSQDMNGKVAIVTGGSSGIGRACAIEFAKAGAKVVVAARREAEGKETIRQIPAMLQTGGGAIVNMA